MKTSRRVDQMPRLTEATQTPIPLMSTADIKRAITDTSRDMALSETDANRDRLGGRLTQLYLELDERRP